MNLLKNKFTLFLLFISFLEGASLMAIEISSSKLIAPYFGNSLYVWTSVLSITIASLSLGYFLGGILSAKYDPLYFLKWTLLTSCILLFLTIYLNQFILNHFVDTHLKTGVLLSSFLLIFPLVFCFGLVSPLIINILTNELKDVGQYAGYVYTISTFGGIIMTFLTGLYLVPFVGVKTTLWIVLIILLLTTFISFFLSKSRSIHKPVFLAEKQMTDQKSERLKPFILILAFIEGSIVIAIELFGSKMMQPIIGNSFIVWTIVIGSTISYLTLGYFIGGKLSSKKMNHAGLIAYFFSFASIYTLLSPLISVELAFSFIQQSLYLGGFALTSLVIAPPLILLGATTPLLIQYSTKEVNSAGKNAGLIYSVSSIGGIFSTLLIGMYILPQWGIVKPLIIFSTILFFSALIIYRNWKQTLLFILFVFFGLYTYSTFNSFEWETKNLKIQHISEGLMGQLKVFDEYFPIEELEYRFLLINGICQTMIVNHPAVVSTWKYIHRSSRIASMKRNKEALILGLGGGSMASELNKLNIKADLVDIDKRMFELSKKYFYYKDTISTFYEDDARHFVNTIQKKYDLIIIDLASGENQPNNIFTKEGLKKITDLLQTDGLIIINFQEHVNAHKISPHHSICNTILSLGWHVQYHKTKSKSPDIVTVISKKHTDLNHIPLSQLSASYDYLGEMQQLIVEPFEEVKKPFKDGIILSDDQPLLDIINAKTIFSWRQDNNRIYNQKHLKLHHPIFN